MATSFRPLEIRRALGKDVWGIPREFGPDGWVIDMNTVEQTARIIVSAGPIGPDETEDWTLMHRAIWPDGWAYQVFAPPSDHVNIHQYALHLWGAPDGRALLPNFGSMGTI